MKCHLTAAALLCLALAMPGLAADKKSKTPPPTPSTLPPTAPTLVIPPVDTTAAGNPQPGKLISSEMSGRDLEFFTAASAAGREQSYFVDLLRAKAGSDTIKALAETLGGAQEEENKLLAKLAVVKGWNVSLEPAAEQKKEGAALDKLTGSDFDKAALDKISTASLQAMTAYQNAALSSDPQIKTFASQMLPLAEEKRHLVEKMTGTGNKAAGRLFRHSASGEEPATAPAATTPRPKSTPPAKASPAGKPTPSPKPTPTPAASPDGQKQRPGHDTPKPAATPKPASAASTQPIATPPGQTLFTGTPAPVMPAILSSKSALALPVATPIPPPTPAVPVK